MTSTHIPIVPPGKWRAASARAAAATATKRIEGIHASAGMATTAILTSLTAAKMSTSASGQKNTVASASVGTYSVHSSAGAHEEPMATTPYPMAA